MQTTIVSARAKQEYVQVMYHRYRGARVRLWKWELQQLANQVGLAVIS